MAVDESIGLDSDGLADRAFDREAAAVDLRPHVLDDDAAAAVVRHLASASVGAFAVSGGPLKISTPSGGSVRLSE